MKTKAPPTRERDPALHPDARTFAGETGTFRLPADADTAGLTPDEFRLLAHICCARDSGTVFDLENLLDLSLRCSMTTERVVRAVDCLKRQNILRETKTEIIVTEASEWENN